MADGRFHDPKHSLVKGDSSIPFSPLEKLTFWMYQAKSNILTALWGLEAGWGWWNKWKAICSPHLKTWCEWTEKSVLVHAYKHTFSSWNGVYNSKRKTPKVIEKRQKALEGQYNPWLCGNQLFSQLGASTLQTPGWCTNCLIKFHHIKPVSWI